MIIDRTFTNEERLEISKILSTHHTIFQTFWAVGKPIFTSSIKTAAVGFDKQGYTLYMIINPDFWDSLDTINKAFVISHECLHIVLKHGSRGRQFEDQEGVNEAMDIVINEMLVASFGFNKYDIQDWQNLCFVDTIFDKDTIIEHQIHTRGSFIYYLELMNKAGFDTSKQTVDNHGSGLGEGSDEIQDYMDQMSEYGQEAVETLAEEVEPKLNEQERFDLGKNLGADLQECTGAGNHPMGNYVKIDLFKPKKKKKWEEIVKKHLKSVMKYETVDKPAWINRDRRHACLDPDLLVQGMWPVEVPMKTKYKIVFFLDTSGSCFSYAKRFVKMLQTIPEETFDIEAYAFDARLYPIDLKTGKVHGGGGTYFHILDRKIREITKAKKHPDAVFVLSDGDGDAFNPEKPHLWHWILTPYHNTHLIPKASHKHNMANFE